MAEQAGGGRVDPALNSGGRCGEIRAGLVRRLRARFATALPGGFGTRPGGTTAPAQGAGCMGMRRLLRISGSADRSRRENDRSRAPRGAPAGEPAGHLRAITGWVRSRDGPSGAAASAPALVGALLPSFFKGAGKTQRAPDPCQTGPAERWLFDNRIGDDATERAAHSVATLPWRGRVGEQSEANASRGWGELIRMQIEDHPHP